MSDIDKDFAWLRFHIRKLPQWMEADTLSKRIEFDRDKLALEVDELRLEVAECHDDLRATRSVSVALEIAQSRVQELEGAMDEQDRIHDERFARIAELEATVEAQQRGLAENAEKFYALQACEAKLREENERLRGQRDEFATWIDRHNRSAHNTLSHEQMGLDPTPPKEEK